MLTSVIESLAHEGVAVRLLDTPPEVDLYLELTLDGRQYHLAVARRARSPYPGELERLVERRAELGRWGTPTLVAPFVSDSVARLLVPMGWSWADDHGNYDLRIARGVRLSRRATMQRPKTRSPKRLPQGSGASALLRILVWDPSRTQRRTTDLARLAGVTHARASQVLKELRELDLVTKRGDEWNPDREALIGRFVEDYRGPGGSEQFFYSVDRPAVMCKSLLTNVDSRNMNRTAVSADVGPDLLAPWRRPTVVTIYVGGVQRLGVQALAETTDRQSANVIIRSPADMSVFRPSALVAPLDGMEVPLADPMQMIWDLHDLGGGDREDAAAHLTQWLLARA